MVLPVLFKQQLSRGRIEVFVNLAYIGKNEKQIVINWEFGFLLCYKRIENGKLKWPRTKDEVRTLTNQQVRWLLEGLSIDQPRAKSMEELAQLALDTLKSALDSIEASREFLVVACNKISSIQGGEKFWKLQIRCFSCFKKPIKPIKHNNKPFRILQLKSNY
ncbi:hypothetical protein EfmAA818_25820 [Enterococcus faecium]|nr:hypothetical protein EfmAA818_25820 [Enterococcus faecium]